ncbi:hypothetical protein BU16DRAFT_555487 [Lophium mytilinum]|uniref:Uncharacterized protein n=1 Tax=Lophium mytilinum TaxID=390894 RepID=A0A6A6R8V9_9PEZI|nr:hypothetical protein BU16DRAFT_555487 [Lophium mytilinum]
MAVMVGDESDVEEGTVVSVPEEVVLLLVSERLFVPVDNGVEAIEENSLEDEALAELLFTPAEGDTKDGENDVLKVELLGGPLLNVPDGDGENDDESSLEEGLPDGLLFGLLGGDTEGGEDTALEDDALLFDKRVGGIEIGEESMLEDEDALEVEIATERVVGIVVGIEDENPDAPPEVVADTEAGLMLLVMEELFDPEDDDVGDGEEAALGEIATEKVVGTVVEIDDGDPDALFEVVADTDAGLELLLMERLFVHTVEDARGDEENAAEDVMLDEVTTLGCVGVEEEIASLDRLLDTPEVDDSDEVEFEYILCERLSVVEVMLGDERPALDPVLVNEEIVTLVELLDTPDVKELPVISAVLKDRLPLEEEFPKL